MDVYIICGGEGKRVSAYTTWYECSKHEIPINGIPFNVYMERWLRSNRIIGNVYYSDQPGVGTGGAIKSMDKYLKIDIRVPFVAIYGDCYSPIDIYDMYRELLELDADMMVATRLVNEPDYGKVNVYHGNEYDYVESYVRKHDSDSYMTNTGMYMIDRRAYEYIRNIPWDTSGSVSLEDNFNAIFRSLRCISYDTTELPYYDIGTPKRIISTMEVLGR